MTYPITERTYFTSKKLAWDFVQAIGKLQHHVISNYGVDNTNENEPFFVETLNDPFRSKDELMKFIG